MILQSKDKFDELARVNDNTGEVGFVSKHQNHEFALLPINGAYSIVDGKMCALYRKDNSLFVKIDEREFEVLDDVESEFKQDNSSNIFQLTKGKKLLLTFRYNAPVVEPSLESDPTPFVEYEDFDFLCFVHNVLRNSRRRHRIYSQ